MRGVRPEATRRTEGVAPLARSAEDDAAPEIYPCRTYARHCVLAARSLGADAEASFLDHTFLADRRTTLRTYLESDPDLMEEKPRRSSPSGTADDAAKARRDGERVARGCATHDRDA